MQKAIEAIKVAFEKKDITLTQVNFDLSKNRSLIKGEVIDDKGDTSSLVGCFTIPGACNEPGYSSDVWEFCAFKQWVWVDHSDLDVETLGNTEGMVDIPKVWVGGCSVDPVTYRRETTEKLRLNLDRHFMTTNEISRVPTYLNPRLAHGYITLPITNGDVIKIDVSNNRVQHIEARGGKMSWMASWDPKKTKCDPLTVLVDYIKSLQELDKIEENMT